MEPSKVAVLIAVIVLLAAVVGLAMPGLQGEQGIVGPVGPSGTQGVSGIQGSEGPRGSAGDKGDRGDRGEVGLAGPKGDRGDLGLGDTILATLSSSDFKVSPEEEITIIGTAFFHAPYIWLFYYDKSEETVVWRLLEDEVSLNDNNTFEIEVEIPDDAAEGVAEIAAKLSPGWDAQTYVTLPILIED